MLDRNEAATTYTAARRREESISICHIFGALDSCVWFSSHAQLASQYLDSHG
jgi:hypothetical protein